MSTEHITAPYLDYSDHCSKYPYIYVNFTYIYVISRSNIPQYKHFIPHSKKNSKKYIFNLFMFFFDDIVTLLIYSQNIHKYILCKIMYKNVSTNTNNIHRLNQYVVYMFASF